MTEARAEFAYLDNLDPIALHAERTALLDTAPGGDFQKLDDNSLTKLWAVMRALRRKSGASGSRKGRGPKVHKIEDLA